MNNVGLVLFGSVYTYALFETHNNVVKRLREQRAQQHQQQPYSGGSPMAHAMLRDASPLSAAWTLFSGVFTNMAVIVLTMLLALYLWHYSVVGEVRHEVDLFSRTEARSRFNLVDAFVVAFGNLLRSDVLSLLAYAVAATIVYVYYYLLILHVRKPHHAPSSAQAYDVFVERAYAFNLLFVCGMLVLRMMM